MILLGCLFALFCTSLEVERLGHAFERPRAAAEGIGRAGRARQSSACQVSTVCKYGTVWQVARHAYVRRLSCPFGMERSVTEALHPSAPHDLPGFITAPGDTDVLMIVIGIVLIGSVLAVGNFYLHLHTLPERMAHKSQKLQFEIVAVLGLLALFTHNHLFWVIGLVLAMIDLPDFGTPLRRIAGSVEKIAGGPPDDEEVPGEGAAAAAHGPDAAKADAAKRGVPSHA